MGILEGCKSQKEVLKGNLDDAIFSADFGNLISVKAPPLYGNAKTFFNKTQPAKRLCKVIEAIFGRIANPKESGATIRLSGSNIGNPPLRSKFLPAAGRPEKVRVVAVGAGKAGITEFSGHGLFEVHSLWRKIFANWQAAGYIPPVVKNNEPTHWFTVEHNEKVVAMGATTQKTTQKQQEILTYLKDHSTAGRKEITASIGGITEDGIKANLHALQQKGLLKRIGLAKGGYWEVIEAGG